MRPRALGCVPLVLLLTGCGPTLDARTLAASVAPAYASLYVRAQEQQGRTDVTAGGLSATATCTRGGGDTLDVGPGDDWRCLVSTTPGGGPVVQVLYEVTLTPEGCYRADGPPAVVGDAQVVDVDGRRRINPVYAFDGCLG